MDKTSTARRTDEPVSGSDALWWGVTFAGLTFVVALVLSAVRAQPTTASKWTELVTNAFVLAVAMFAWTFAWRKEWLSPRLMQLLYAVATVMAVEYLIYVDPDADWWTVGEMVVLVAVVVGFTRFWKLWWIRSPREDASVAVVVGSSVVALAILVLFFSALTGVLVEKDLVDTERTLGSDAVFDLQGYYLWHFADAVPALKVPETVNWEKPTNEPLGYEGGVLLLLFKLAVILPVVAAIMDAWKRLKPKESPTDKAETSNA